MLHDNWEMLPVVLEGTNVVLFDITHFCLVELHPILLDLQIIIHRFAMKTLTSVTSSTGTPLNTYNLATVLHPQPSLRTVASTDQTSQERPLLRSSSDLFKTVKFL